MKSREELIAEIAKIDDMFENAKCWGSWMASASDRRYGLVEEVNRRWNDNLEHKFVMKAGGRRVID